MKRENDIRFVFFGTPQFSVFVLEELEQRGFIPSIVVTAPDKPRGRGLDISPSPVKLWAQKRNIPVLEPQKLDEDFISSLTSALSNKKQWDVLIVAAYGFIIPKEVLDLPKKGSVNIHPSLLPRYRGAAPVQTQILEDDEETGVTIMLMDEKMDHGSILAQEIVPAPTWPPRASLLEELLARRGGALLAEILPDWVDGNIDPQEQEHEYATFTKKIKKEDGLIDLSENPKKNLLKIRAFDQWPRAYFLDERGKRTIVTDAEIEDGKLKIKKIISEGKKEKIYP
jgi:methionyl-tRNA formyltransferase